jgi:hypothetical protein
MLEIGYSPSEFKNRAGNLREASKILNNEIGEIAPEAEILLFGSLGRRIAMWEIYEPNGKTLGEFLETAPEMLHPRRNERRGWDIDIGVSDKTINWQQITSISRKVTKYYPQIEVDPHLMSMRGTNEFRISNYRALKKGEYLKFKTQTVEVEGSELPWKPIDIDTMLTYYFEFGKLRPKDVRDIAFTVLFLTREVNYEEEVIGQRVKAGMLDYLKSPRLGVDLLRIGYLTFMPRFIQAEVRKIRHGSKLGRFNFNSPEALYI